MWFRIDSRFSAHGEPDGPIESGKQNPDLSLPCSSVKN